MIFIRRPLQGQRTEIPETRLPQVNSVEGTNLDRTSHNRRNSDLRPLFDLPKSEKFRFLSAVFSPFLCCFCSILIVLKGLSSSSKNRTRPGFMLIPAQIGKNTILSALAERIVPVMRRFPAAIVKGTSIRTARLLNFNQKQAQLLLYSSTGTRARRKKFSISLPLIHFLRSLDALVAPCKSRERISPKCDAFRASARRGIFPQEVSQ